VAKKKKSIYSRRLKDVNKDGKRNFGDTFLGDLLGADGKVGIGKGRPGLIDSLKGERREKPITKKPKKKLPVGKKPKARPKKKAEPNVRVGIKTSTTVVDKSLPSNRPSRDQRSTNKTKKEVDTTSGTPSFRNRSKDVKKSDVPFADRVKGEEVNNKAVPKDQRDSNDQQSSRNKQIYVSPYVKAITDFFKVDSVVKNPKGRNKTRTRSGNSKGGMIDYRKTGMFYGGMTKRGKK